jgi:putative transposase
MVDRSRLPFTPRSPEALFRFQVVSQVRARTLAGETLARAIRAVGATPVLDAASMQPRRVSERSIYRWVAAFAARGMAGLEPKARQAAAASRVLPERLLEFVRTERDLDPRASLPEMLRRARENRILSANERVDRTTLWRACSRMGLPMRRRQQQCQADVRSFAYPHRMMMLLADGKHFRAGRNHTKRVALFFLDDASRKGLEVVVGPSESTELFLRGLYGTTREAGLADVVYLDNGPGFISDDTQAVVAALPSHLVLGTAGYPEGHGKIERFNQTAQDDLLRSLAGAPDVDDDPGALELRLRHYVREQYNRRPHDSLDGQSPAARWDADTRPLRFPTSDEELRAKFVVTFGRKVTNDNLVPFGRVDYEVPRGYAGKHIRVYRHLLEGDLFVIHDGLMVRLRPVDRARNAVDRRAPRLAPPKPAPGPGDPGGLPPARSAATLAFERDFGPLVGPDGGFTAATTHDAEEEPDENGHAQ